MSCGCTSASLSPQGSSPNPALKPMLSPRSQTPALPPRPNSLGRGQVGSITESWSSSSSSCHSDPPSTGPCCPSSAASHKGTGRSCGVRMGQTTDPAAQPGAPGGVCEGLAQWASQWARVSHTQGLRHQADLPAGYIGTATGACPCISAQASVWHL